LIGALAAVFNNPSIGLRSRELLASCWLRAAYFSFCCGFALLWPVRFEAQLSSASVRSARGKQ
jgi:hypothetical protein